MNILYLHSIFYCSVIISNFSLISLISFSTSASQTTGVYHLFAYSSAHQSLSIRRIVMLYGISLRIKLCFFFIFFFFFFSSFFSCRFSLLSIILRNLYLVRSTNQKATIKTEKRILTYRIIEE